MNIDLCIIRYFDEEGLISLGDSYAIWWFIALKSSCLTGPIDYHLVGGGGGCPSPLCSMSTFKYISFISEFYNLTTKVIYKEKKQIYFKC